MKTNYEAIKEMSLEEMSAVFYFFLKPVIEAFDLDEEKEFKETMKRHIRTFLAAEVRIK